MTWLLPTKAIIPSGGEVRCVGGDRKRRAYHRAYYHAKRKPHKQERTPEQKARRSEARMALYYKNIERERANARARYWRKKAERRDGESN